MWAIGSIKEDYLGYVDNSHHPDGRQADIFVAGVSRTEDRRMHLQVFAVTVRSAELSIQSSLVLPKDNDFRILVVDGQAPCFRTKHGRETTLGMSLVAFRLTRPRGAQLPLLHYNVVDGEKYAGADCHVRASIAYQRELLSPAKQDEPFRGDLASIVASNSAISSYDYLNDPNQNHRFDPASPPRIRDHCNRRLPSE